MTRPDDLPPPPAKDEDSAREWREWHRLLDAGLIGAPLPEAPPEVAAIRDANAALFRRLRWPRPSIW